MHSDWTFKIKSMRFVKSIVWNVSELFLCVSNSKHFHCLMDATTFLFLWSPCINNKSITHLKMLNTKLKSTINERFFYNSVVQTSNFIPAIYLIRIPAKSEFRKLVNSPKGIQSPREAEYLRSLYIFWLVRSIWCLSLQHSRIRSTLSDFKVEVWPYFPTPSV